MPIGRRSKSGMTVTWFGPSRDGPRPLPPMRYAPLSREEVADLLKPYGAIALDEEELLAGHYTAQVHNNGLPSRAVALAADLYDDLSQLNFHVKSVAVLLTEHSRRLVEGLRREKRGLGGETITSIRERDQLRETMFTHADSFYMNAHRVQDRLGKRGLPEIKRYRRVEAITNIRNHLLEHPLRTYRSIKGSKSAVHPVNGPMILTSRLPEEWQERDREVDRTMDYGLFVNAKEFKGSVHDVLSRALDALGGPVPTLAEHRARRPR